MLRLAVLGSTRGTNLLPIIHAIADKHLSASIEVVMSNKSDALILERANTHQVKTIFVDPKGLTREQYDQQVLDALQAYQIDLIVLIGYMRILSPIFFKDWHEKIINVHPSLLPAHAGKMDLDVHRAVIAANERETGCTVHYVTEEVDAGPIVLQKKCQVLETDTPEILKERVQVLEGQALVEAIRIIATRN